MRRPAPGEPDSRSSDNVGITIKVEGQRPAWDARGAQKRGTGEPRL